MPILANFDPDRGLLAECGRGRLGREDFLSHLDALAGLGLHPGLRILGDYEEASIELTSVDVAAVGNRVRTVLGAAAPVSVAFAARGDLSFGVVRMLASRTQGPGLDIRVFRDVATARAWLDGCASALHPDGASLPHLS